MDLKIARQQLDYLSSIIELEKIFRAAETPEHASFLMLNESTKLIKYKQAFFWRIKKANDVVIENVSGTDSFDIRSPYIDFIIKFAKNIVSSNQHDSIKCFCLSDIVNPDDKDAWLEWGIGELLYCPLTGPDKKAGGGIFFIRSEPWLDAEKEIASIITSSFYYAWLAHFSCHKAFFIECFESVSEKKSRKYLIAFFFLLMIFPIRLSSVGSLEIKSKNPYIITAPVEAVVKEFFVVPNQKVEKGGLLFKFDDIKIRNEYEVVSKALNVAKAELKSSTQKGFIDEPSRAMAQILESRVDLKQAELNYLSEKLSLIQIKAPIDGVVIFSDQYDWLGKPVSIGEKIMEVAAPSDVEAEIMLPVQDAINVDNGSEIKVFLNIEPQKPLKASLKHAGYEAETTPSGIVAFRLKGDFEAGQKIPRIGLRGSAKIYGKRVPFFYYILRKPLSYIRQLTGL